MVTSCSDGGEKSNTLYTGEWELVFKELPNIGDKEVNMFLNEKDSIMIGYFVDKDGIRVDFSKITFNKEGGMRVKYEWGGHKVGFSVKVENTKNNYMEGSFMGIFDVEGKRIK